MHGINKCMLRLDGLTTTGLLIYMDAQVDRVFSQTEEISIFFIGQLIFLQQFFPNAVQFYTVLHEHNSGVTRCPSNDDVL